MLTTPVAFFIYNRPDLTRRVFNAIRLAKPKKLLVVADGPRSDAEEERCQETRDVIKAVDWECEILTNLSEKNMGCGKRVATGLNWVFSKVDQAIILEDDCLPTPSFFDFCKELLIKYRDDRRIMQIGGNNFQADKSITKHSYYFSRYPHIWGWATWKRAWECYDFYMKTWPQLKQSGKMNRVCKNFWERIYWTNIFDRRFLKGKPDTWDYQWVYSCWYHEGLSIYPAQNLVSNIGFGRQAVHTRQRSSSFANLPTKDIWEIKHPPAVSSHEEADKHTFKYIYKATSLRSCWQMLKAKFE